MELTTEKKMEICELVEKQKKAKISWIAIISQVTEEQLKASAPDLGLVINNDEIMLSSETEEGKQATMVNTNYEKLIHYAIEERVIRIYDGGFDNKETKIIATSIALTAVLGVFGAAVGGSLRIASYGKPTDPTKMKFGNVETSKCLFDGRIEYSLTKSTEMEPVKEHLYHEISGLTKDKMHALVPIKLYYELIMLLDNRAKNFTEDQKNLLLSLCDHLDTWIRDFSNSIANNSAVEQEGKSKSKSYQLLLITGEKIETNEKLLIFNKISIYLSYRTKMNQIYYDLVQKGLIPDLLDFILNLKSDHHQLLEQHIQYLFQEFMKYLTENNLTDNIELIDLIVKTQ
ncbi:MAG: hypothetical protein JXA54_15235 [Candidatus Heimdallarchaeota archaeon]|nr:hypothetical protein [Candidatus Heimdallarchaeota archaeon]